MAVSIKVKPTSIGEVGSTGVYRLDLGALGVGTIRNITIYDDNVISGGTGGASGFDLDFVKISSTFTSSASTAAGLASLPVFNFGAGTALQTGFMQTWSTFDPAAWNTNILFGTSGPNALNSGLSSLGVRDGSNAANSGAVSLGEGGNISFSLTGAVAAAGNYLYIGDAGGGNDDSFVTISDTSAGPVAGAFTLTATSLSDFIGMQRGLNAFIGAFGDTIDGGFGNDTIYGGDGNDFLIGGGDNDQLFGDEGLDQIYGGTGNDYMQADGGVSSVLVGEAGNDTIYGGLFDDYMVGGTGTDVIVGLGGINSMYGGDGNDYMVAGDGVGSVVDGGAGANSLWGGSGNDYAVGGEGNDILAMFGGSDYIFGNAGNDGIFGGTGTDYIFGGAGNDFIYTDDFGSAFKDYLYVGPGTGVDTVVDFTAGFGASDDVIVMVGTAARSFSDVMAGATQVGVYTVISVSPTDQVYLYNVSMAQLSASNFIFI